MVSPVVAQAILSNRTPDIAGAFRQGERIAMQREDEARQAESRELAGRALQEGGGDSLQQLFAINPQLGADIQNRLGIQSGKDFEQFVESARIGEAMLGSGQVDEFINFANQRANILDAQGRNSDQTRRIAEIARVNPEAAMKELRTFNQSLTDIQQVAKSAGQREFEALIDPLSEEEQLQARRVKAGIAARPIDRLTAEQQQEIERSKAIGREGGKASIKKGEEAFDKLPKIDRAIGNINKAIEAIDNNAQTGTIQRFLPTVTQASKQLDQIRNEMGLDVIGATSFGALSESEMDFALSTALPDNMSPENLRKWLVDKRESQQKAREALEQAAIFLSSGGNLSDYLKQQKTRREEAQEASAPQVEAAAPAQPAAQPQRLVYNPQTGQLEPK